MKCFSRVHSLGLDSQPTFTIIKFSQSMSILSAIKKKKILKYFNICSIVEGIVTTEQTFSFKLVVFYLYYKYYR